MQLPDSKRFFESGHHLNNHKCKGSQHWLPHHHQCAWHPYPWWSSAAMPDDPPLTDFHKNTANNNPMPAPHKIMTVKIHDTPQLVQEKSSLMISLQQHEPSTTSETMPSRLLPMPSACCPCTNHIMILCQQCHSAGAIAVSTISPTTCAVPLLMK